jgi:hypothetical protein
LKNLKGLLKDATLTAGFDALLDIPGVWDGMRLTTLQNVTAIGCREVGNALTLRLLLIVAQQECLNYLGRIREVFVGLVGNNKHTLRNIDSATVKALEQRAPRASTADAQLLRNQMRGGQIFNAFSDGERDKIWDRLQMVDGIVPSLFTFFRDVQYLKLCVDCLKRLVTVQRHESVFVALQRAYTRKNQVAGQVKIQIIEGTFNHQAGTPADGSELGVRQLIAMAMRSYPSLPADPVHEDSVQKATVKADPTVLHRLANLAYDLGFDSPEIRLITQSPNSRITPFDSTPSSPLLVTSGPGVAMPHRSGVPRRKAFEEAREFLYINHLHDGQQHQGEGITSFFVRKSVYLNFFGRPNSRTGGTAYRSPTISPSRSTTNLMRESSPGESSYATRPHSEELPASAEQMEDIDDILLSYAQRDNDDLYANTVEGVSLAPDPDITLHQLEEREMQEREREERERREREGRNIKRQEQERSARAKAERKRQDEARLEQERLIKERSEQARLEEERLYEQRLEHREVVIKFIIYERGSWRDLPPIGVNPGDPTEVERIAKKYMRKDIRTFNTQLQMLAPQECFQAVVDDQTHTILLVLHDGLHFDHEMMESVSKHLRTEDQFINNSCDLRTLL